MAKAASVLAGPILDNLLVRAAAAAGVEVREAFSVTSLLFADDRVVGIRGNHKAAVFEERARIVIGADGLHSFVANAVDAPVYDARPVAACGYYSYFSDVPQEDIELYMRSHWAFGGVPTHDGLCLVMVNWPARDFPAVRADIEAHVWRAVESSPDFAGRVRSGTRQERWYGTAGIPGYFRKPYGDGWALVGDASHCKDPITAQGMSDAFIDAEMITRGDRCRPVGARRLDDLLAAHEAARNERARAMYEFSYQTASFEPTPPHMQALFGALRGNQDATNAFLSAITGAIPLPEFMSDENLGRIMSAAGAHSSRHE